MKRNLWLVAAATALASWVASCVRCDRPIWPDGTPDGDSEPVAFIFPSVTENRDAVWSVQVRGDLVVVTVEDGADSARVTFRRVDEERPTLGFPTGYQTGE